MTEQNKQAKPSAQNDKQEIAKQPQSRSLRQWCNSDQFQEALSKALPRHVSVDRMIRVAMTQLTRNPKLAECTQQSFLTSMMDAGAVGLEPDGRQGHLVPFWNGQKKCREAKWIAGYQGLIELAYRTGQVLSISAAIIYEGDVFEYSVGKVRDHVPWEWRTGPKRPKSMGEIRGAYVIVELAGGGSHHEVMTTRQIEEIRARSASKDKGPWVTDWSEMAKKTVLRRAAKWIPQSAELRQALEQADEQDAIIADALDVKSVAGDAGDDELVAALSEGAD